MVWHWNGFYVLQYPQYKENMACGVERISIIKKLWCMVWIWNGFYVLQYPQYKETMVYGVELKWFPDPLYSWGKTEHFFSYF